MPQRVRDELRRQPRLGGGALEVLLVGAAGHVLVPASLEQVSALGAAVVYGVLVDCLGYRNQQWDVAELALGPETSGAELRDRFTCSRTGRVGQARFTCRNSMPSNNRRGGPPSGTFHSLKSVSRTAGTLSAPRREIV